MIVTCIIALLTCGDIKFIFDVPIKVEVKQSNESLYLVDASKSKEAQRYCTNLSKPIVVSKSKCFK